MTARKTAGQRPSKTSPKPKATTPARRAPSARPKAKSKPTSEAKSKPRSKSKAKAKAVKLLSGGNPQIAKADGDAPVQAWLAALPGWKSAVGLRLDALIVRAVPNVQKAVKWNSPFYGVAGQGFFLGVHAYNHYLKLAFFRGALLQPPPPGQSKSKEVRYLDVREHDALDEAQLGAWLKQAAALPGWAP